MQPMTPYPRATDYRELLGNGRVYRVPRYQRDYSWTSKQWDDLWMDILEVRAGREDRHYLGTLVVESTNDREFTVIDGQQRLATLSVLALAVIAKLEDLARDGIDSEANRERSKALRNRFVGEKDPASLVEHSRLTLNHTNDGFYQDILVQLREPHNLHGLAASNRQLWEAFGYFRTHLDEMADVTNDGEALAGILSENVGRGLLFIVITVDDELTAYTVFDTLNARWGLELTTTDLLKNFLFSTVRVKSDRYVLDQRWQSLVTALEPSCFPDFLRYHLLCAHSEVRGRRLFEIVRSEIRSADDVFGLFDAIEPRGELFAALREPAHEYWTDIPGAKRSVSELILFEARWATPLLFAMWDHLPPREFAKSLRVVNTIAFRYSVVGRLCGVRLESAGHQAAKAVTAGGVRNARGLFEELGSVYVEDAQFRRSFAELAIAGSRRKLIKYVLARFEGDASGRECDHDNDPGAVEYILPRNPTNDWCHAFPGRQLPVNRLGNLTLVEGGIYARIGNAVYREKVVEYGKSAYALTREVSELAPEDWNWASLEKRQVLMAERATDLWRVEV